MSVETRVINLTSSAQVITGECWIEGFYVNSTTSGTLKLWHGTSGADTGEAISDTMTPAAGWHYLGGLHTTAGVYAGIGGTALNVSIHYKTAN